jgi:hypothetical protein
MSYGWKKSVDPKEVLARLDAVSKHRALEDRETDLLEWAIKVLDGNTDLAKRLPWGAIKILARIGVKRDMTVYRTGRPKGRLGVAGREALRRKTRGE